VPEDDEVRALTPRVNKPALRGSDKTLGHWHGVSWVGFLGLGGPSHDRNTTSGRIL
jgi:hypothetical protein